MEIVIKIPKEMITSIEQGSFGAKYDIYDLVGCVMNGTPLPKGHGDLVDRDNINSRFYDIWHELSSYSNKPSHKELLDKWSMCMDTAPTIIEADKEDKR
jgi:hypothetical protein